MSNEQDIVVAAARFQRAWEKAMAANGEGLLVADLDIVEVHESALELIRTTGTDNLHDALDTLHRLEP
jgi:hypothetical protein